MSNHRILWIFNHTSLRKFEVPMLIQMGYEVYCPKIYDVEYGDLSASIDYKFDSSLTIPDDVLEVLNETNFYHNLSCELLHIINKYFDIVFCMPLLEPLRSLLQGFHGNIVLHAFGLADDYCYGNVLYEAGGIQLLTLIKRAGNRFWFGETYENISEIEPEVIQRRAIFLPIGLKMDEKNADTWEGGEGRILFVGPKINSNSYYHEVYKNFKEEFGMLPHTISGAQIIPVKDDDTVTGFLSSEQFHYNMTHLAAMYYHSQNPRHLHYHPLEAVLFGMPLVYMAGGMLDYLVGTDFPGRCRTKQEARNKLKRLLKGDKRLIERIRKTQKKLLYPFSDEYCIPYWKKALPLIDQKQESVFNKKKIVIVLPAAYKGGVLDYSIRFTVAIYDEDKKNGNNLDITFAYPSDKQYMNDDCFEPLKERGITLTEYSVLFRDKEWLTKKYKIEGYQPPRIGYSFSDGMCILDDGMSNFENFDFAFVMSDTSPGISPIYWDIPHAVVVHDYIQRYVSDVVSLKANQVKIVNQNKADYIIVTSEPTFEDAISYAGHSREKVVLSPLLLDIVSAEKISKKRKPYFVWSTNISKHKNHIIAMESLARYYNAGGQLQCRITGAFTSYLSYDADLSALSDDRREYLNQIHELYERFPILRKKIKVMGNLPKQEYLNLIAGAEFVFHMGYGDNGNASVIDAAGASVPALVSDYPAMRYIEKFSGVPFKYADPFNVNGIADALKDMEASHEELRKRIPGIEVLKKVSYEYKAKELYNVVREMIKV